MENGEFERERSWEWPGRPRPIRDVNESEEVTMIRATWIKISMHELNGNKWRIHNNGSGLDVDAFWWCTHEINKEIVIRDLGMGWDGK